MEAQARRCGSANVCAQGHEHMVPVATIVSTPLYPGAEIWVDMVVSALDKWQKPKEKHACAVQSTMSICHTVIPGWRIAPRCISNKLPN
jgi:hypothetical protein